MKEVILISAFRSTVISNVHIVYIFKMSFLILEINMKMLRYIPAEWSYCARIRHIK